MSDCPDCEAPAKFHVNDMVRVIECPDKQVVGRIGRIATEKNCDTYWVEMDGKEWWMAEKQLELVEALEMKCTPTHEEIDALQKAKPEGIIDVPTHPDYQDPMPRETTHP